MLGDLSSDIMGTNPAYPPIVDHGWMDPHPAGYDNFPSDNNPVRVIPKLSELWRTKDVGFSVMPNQALSVMGQQLSSPVAPAASIADVAREARKAVMSGKTGKQLADHLRGVFTPRQIEAAKEELEKVASEVGLLGNVYVDARAFANYDEADRFLMKNRNRLARDLLYDPEAMNPTVVAFLASKYRKNAVTEISYDTDLFTHYKDHLVQSGRLPSDFSVDSKENLRKAFLHQMPEPEPAPKAKEHKLSSEELAEGLRQLAERNAKVSRDAADVGLLKTVRPVIAFIQEQLSKGKTGNDLKGMIRARFVPEDIKLAGKLISYTVSKQGLDSEYINEKIASGEISEIIGDELKKIAKQFPVKKVDYPDPQPSSRFSGVKETFYAPLANVAVTDEHESYRKKAYEALTKGIEPDRILAKLNEKLSAEAAGKVLGDAVIMLNARSAGAVANKAPKSPKVIVEEPVRASRLPDPSTIIPETQEILSFFEGSQMDQIDISPEISYDSMEIGGLSDQAGIDDLLK